MHFGDAPAVRIHQLPQLEHHFGAAGERRGAPFGEGALGDTDRVIDLVDAGEIDLGLQSRLWPDSTPRRSGRMRKRPAPADPVVHRSYAHADIRNRHTHLPIQRKTLPEPPSLSRALISSTVVRLKSPAVECFRQLAATANSSASWEEGSVRKP